MEARNFITAREMLSMDHWIFTSMNNEPRYEKPPLPTWITAISMFLFGAKSLFALRLPAAIMGTLTVIFIYKTGAKITRNRKYAFLAGLVAVTSFYILYSGRDGQWDIFTHGFMIMAIYFMWHLFTETRNVYYNALISGVLIGFSFLSKAPVSIYALLLPFLISFGIIYKFKNFKRLYKPLILLILSAFVISASWSLYVYFLDMQAVTSITDTEAGRWLNYNVRPFYYYWSFVVQSGIWTIPAFVGLLYPYLKNKVLDKKAYQFTLLWTLASVVLLSLIPEKKSRYLLPVLIPMALNTAFYIEYLFRNFKTLSKRENWVVYFNFGLIALIGLAFPIGAGIYFGSNLSLIWPWYLVTSICLVSIGVGIFYFLKEKRFAPVFYLCIWFIISIIFFGLPMAKKIETNPDYNSIYNAKLYIEKEKANLYELDGFTPELIWEFGEPIEVIRKKEGYLLPKEDKFLMLVTEDQTDTLPSVFNNYSFTKLDSFDMNPVGNKHKDRLFRNLYLIERK